MLLANRRIQSNKGLYSLIYLHGGDFLLDPLPLHSIINISHILPFLSLFPCHLDNTALMSFLILNEHSQTYEAGHVAFYRSVGC